MKIISVVGARPNFMKIAPFIRAIENYNNNGIAVEHILVHTGQHYDDRMSKAFFEALDIPNADINLGVGSGSHAEQVGNTMIAFEKVLEKEKPDWVVVVGDVNATLACSVTAKKLNIKVCHIEAGLRSGDMTMPEEINRLVTDRLSDLLLIPDRISGKNLKNEGVPDDKIAFVGNIMIDTLEANRKKASKLSIGDIINDNSLKYSLYDNAFGGGLSPSREPVPASSREGARRAGEVYALLTMHRPSNVDSKEILQPIIEFLSNEVAADMHIIWPIHPRTQNRLKEFGLWDNLLSNDKVVLLHPVGYHEMLKLNMQARVLLTDSGGLQEESTVLGTPCLTLRWNTERPVTLRDHGGASVLVGNNINRIREEYKNTLTLDRKPERPELWDGNTAGRCVQAIVNFK